MTNFLERVQYYVKPEAMPTWEALCANKYVAEDGADKAWRPVFVTIQGAVERALTNMLYEQTISQAICTIHTKMPPTPLRAKLDLPLGEPLVAAEIAADPARLQTVTDRAVILREFLAAGGEIVATFPQSALKACSAPAPSCGLENFHELAAGSPNLHVNPIESGIANNLSGATCLFREAGGQAWLFSIRAFQADSPAEVATFALWLDTYPGAIADARYAEVADYFAGHGLNNMAKDEL